MRILLKKGTASSKREEAKIELAEKVNRLISAHHNQIFATHDKRTIFAPVTATKLPNTEPTDADKGPGAKSLREIVSLPVSSLLAPQHQALPLLGPSLAKSHQSKIK